MEIQEQIKAMIARGESPQSVIAHIAGAGASIMDAIKLIRAAYGVRLGAAKFFVEAQDFWSDDVASSKQLREQIFEWIDSDRSLCHPQYRELTPTELDELYPSILYAR